MSGSVDCFWGPRRRSSAGWDQGRRGGYWRAPGHDRPWVREVAGEAEPAVRVRAPGGGRKSLAESDPGLLLQLKAFVDPETRGDPMSLLVWTTKSTRNLADALTKPGHRVSDRTVARMLADLGFSLQGNTKVLRRRGRRSASLSSRTFRAPARRPDGYENPHRRTPCCILTASPFDIVVE